jgi:hypothetical protein
MSGGGTVTTSATRAEALTVQSSTAGMTIPWVRGMHRLPGNLLWYGDFKANSTFEDAGGKGGGGGGQIEKVTYEASFVMGICQGTIHSIPRIWRGKGTATPSELSLSVFTGAIGQLEWSGLSGYSESLAYSGIAYVAGKRIPLGSAPSVENHSFEIRTPQAYGVNGSIPDVDLAVELRDLMIDANVGVGIPSAMLDAWTLWSDYCRAADLLVSPILTEQTEAREVLKLAASLSNSELVWSDGTLKVVPRGDETLTANGRTYTPNLTPLYAITASHLLAEDGEPPIVRRLVTPEDRHNIVSVEYRDRANQYSIAIAEARDLTDITANGPRPAEVMKAHWITRAAVARFVAEIRKQRNLLVVGEYTFRLPIHFALIECMDLLSLTESGLLLDGTLVRVTSIVESSDDELEITCEDTPTGVGGAPRYPTVAPGGFASDSLTAPPSVTDAVIFEAPGSMAAGAAGLEVWVAVRPAGGNWGGCRLWVSVDDGATYRAVGKLDGGSRLGTLITSPSDTGSAMSVDMMAGQLIGGTSAEADALATLCYIGGASPEFVAYQGATLIGPPGSTQYSLTGVRRGVLRSVAAAHTAGDEFVRVDDAVLRSGPLDSSMVGRTIYLKLTSYNVFGAAEESLASVGAYSHVIAGAFRTPPQTTGGEALNANPAANDPNAWTIEGAQVKFIRTQAAGAVGAEALGAASGTNQYVWSRETIPLNPARTYSLTANLAADTGNNRHVYLTVRMFRADGSELVGADTGWGGSYAGYVYGAPPSPDDGEFRRYGADFGAGVGGRAIPADVAWCRVGVWFQYSGSGSSAVLQAAQDVRLVDVTDARAAAAAAAGASAAAAAASVDATAALGRVAAIDSDSVLARGEKSMAILDWQALVDEEAGIVARATAYGITTENTAYVNAKLTLAGYLGGLSPAWNDTTVDTAIVAAAYRTTWAAVYSARQTVLNRIAEEAGKRAVWATVTGSGRPADNATRNDVYHQPTDPGAVANGSIWIDSSAGGRAWQRVAGAWQPYVGNGSVNTAQLAANSVTKLNQDIHDFGALNVNGALGNQLMRTWTFTPTANCRLSFSASIDAARVQVDSGYSIFYLIEETTGPVTRANLPVTSHSLDAPPARRFTVAFTFDATGGLELRVRIYASVYLGAPTPMILYASSMVALELKK